MHSSGTSHEKIKKQGETKSIVYHPEALSEAGLGERLIDYIESAVNFINLNESEFESGFHESFV